MKQIHVHIWISNISKQTKWNERNFVESYGEGNFSTGYVNTQKWFCYNLHARGDRNTLLKQLMRRTTFASTPGGAVVRRNIWCI